MDPEYGDDLLNGFSGPSDCESECSTADAEGGDNSLDLLSAMIETTQRKKKHTETKRIKKSSKVVSHAEVSDTTTNTSGIDELKAKMEAMQAELKELRQQVAKQPSPKQQITKTSGVPSNRTSSEKLVSGERVRVAHQREDVRPPTAKPPMDRDTSARIVTKRASDKADGVLTEKYSGLRIKNPLVSSEVMSQRMASRKMVRIPRLLAKVKGGEVEGDWVSIGVIVDKLPPKDSKKGDKYSVWKLSDLSGQSAVVTVFLFGQAYQEHWKTPLGYVVALLNPNIMPGKEDAVDLGGVALSLDHPKKLMLMGVSQDFTICKATTKNGRKCTNFANASDGGCCDYHVQSAYSRSRSNRMELQTGYGPSSRGLQDKLLKGSKTDMFFAGGKTFVASGTGGKTNRRDDERLFVPGAKSSAVKAMAELREKSGGVSSRRGVVTQDGSEIFKQMLQKQSVGARMLTKHIKKEEVAKREVDKDSATEKSALQLLKEEGQVRTQTKIARPTLGRGVRPGGMVDLGGSSKASLARRRALAVVKASEDKKASGVKKRVVENRDLTGDDPPQSKRPRLDSGEMDRILNAKSSHDWINEEVELDKEQEYFERLEKKENVELKLQSIKELRVSVVQCKECNYTAEYPGEMCKRESHVLSKFKVMKRCYECKGCHQRQFVYTGRCPVEGCQKCGGTSHEQVSLYRERKGPTLPTEQLKLRGDEEKYLNSLQ
ncbi:protein MCM10 homolog [Halichondria panicea]|uniref:protein MCM10 homolog n=1 Tax=Halichondria panicea TaxID=6063 RepID=UPI00312B6C59